MHAAQIEQRTERSNTKQTESKTNPYRGMQNTCFEMLETSDMFNIMKFDTNSYNSDNTEITACTLYMYTGYISKQMCHL